MTDVLDLTYPFGGRWLVQNSPANRVPSHGTALFATSYAIDFVPVGDGGRSAAAYSGRMATSRQTIDHLLEQLAPLDVRAKAMFGEYGFYCDEVFVGLVCDDTVYLRDACLGGVRAG